MQLNRDRQFAPLLEGGMDGGGVRRGHGEHADSMAGPAPAGKHSMDPHCQVMWKEARPFGGIADSVRGNFPDTRSRGMHRDVGVRQVAWR